MIHKTVFSLRSWTTVSYIVSRNGYISHLTKEKSSYERVNIVENVYYGQKIM